MQEKGEVLVEVRDMCKNFGVTVALNHVNMEIRRGEIRGLIGENGSGKSTVTSIIAGIQPATSGEMTYKGKPWKPANALEAVQNGIGIIVQEAGTIPNISVAENIYLGNYGPFRKGPFVNKKAMAESARGVLERVGIEGIDPAMAAGAYDLEQRKLIELAKTMACNPEIFVVDETTTALSESGRTLLYRVMHQAAEADKAVVFISHDLEELMEHCDTLTILRDGVIIDNLERDQFDPKDIKQKMIGREVTDNYYRSDMDGYENNVVLRADCITAMQDLMCFDLELHRGEILGIGGLSECGMHTLGRVLYGIEEAIDGEVLLTQNGVRVTSAETAFNNKMGYVSKNRDQESLEPNASIAANIQSTGYKKNFSFWPFISGKKERQYAQLQVDALAIKCNSIFQPVRTLSGGNKQKVVFGKWIADDADVLILDCPTRGVDIGVKVAMYNLIYEMKKKGKSIIMISEELPELCGMSDRLLIMKDGQVTGEFYRHSGFNNHEIIECMI